MSAGRTCKGVPPARQYDPRCLLCSMGPRRNAAITELHTEHFREACLLETAGPAALMCFRLALTALCSVERMHLSVPPSD